MTEAAQIREIYQDSVADGVGASTLAAALGLGFLFPIAGASANLDESTAPGGSMSEDTPEYLVKPPIHLGRRYKDSTTQFSGIATAETKYLDGYAMVLLENETGERWFPAPRLSPTGKWLNQDSAHSKAAQRPESAASGQRVVMSMAQVSGIYKGISNATAQLAVAISSLASAGAGDSRQFNRLCEIRNELDNVCSTLNPSVVLEDR